MKIITKLKERRNLARAKFEVANAKVDLAETLKALDFTAKGIKDTIEEALFDPDDALIQVQIQFAESPEEIEELSEELHTLFDLVDEFMQTLFDAAQEVDRLKGGETK